MSDLPRIQALRCFITVAREGTVSRAATLLHLTQPAVSLQLKGLEESTGLLLFNRTPGGFTLTEAGAALLPLAHKAVSATSDFRTAANSLRESFGERCASAPSWIPNRSGWGCSCGALQPRCRRRRSSFATA